LVTESVTFYVDTYGAEYPKYRRRGGGSWEMTPIPYGNSDQGSSHLSHIGCDEGAVGGAACCTPEDRNSTRFRRTLRRGGSWNGRESLGVGVGVGVAGCPESERSPMNTKMGSILNSICNGSSIATIPRQEVAGQSKPTLLSYQFPYSPRYFLMGRNAVRTVGALHGLDGIGTPV
jgi:hypothetical protein